MLDGAGLALIGGVLALLGGLTGSSIGMGIAGPSGTAAIAEDPKQFRNVFLLAALPMTQTFYGFIVLLQMLTYVSGNPNIDVPKGMVLLALGLAVGFAEAFSATYQGIVCGSGISELPRTKGKITFSTMLLAVYVELVGILGMVFAIAAMNMLPQ